MVATVSALYRHPVKGFTPERLAAAHLAVGEGFPCDRLYAVEIGPSGFDAANPAWVSKMQFAVLARIARVAKARTAYDEATGVFSARAEGMPDLAAPLGDDAGRQALADWLTRLLGDEVDAPLKVIAAPGTWRFMDHPLGHVSIINLASEICSSVITVGNW